MVTIDEIIAAFGKYYLAGSQNKSRLLGVPFVEGRTLKIPGMRHIKTKDTIYQMANPIYAKALQQYQRAFTNKGGVSFHPNEIQLRQLKVDDLLYPEDIEESWLGFLGGDSSRTIETWPIVRYLMEVYYAQTIEEEKETDVVYKGEYEAPTAGTAGEGSKVFDGFHKQLLKGAADGQYPINVFEAGVIGEMDVTTAFDQIETFSKGIKSQFTHRKVMIFVAPEFERAYLEGKREKGFYNVKTDGEFSTRIDFTAHTVVGLESMAGTKDIWATLPENMLHIMKRGDELQHFDVQKVDRAVKLLMDWWEAVGFGVNKLVWASAETVATA